MMFRHFLNPTSHVIIMIMVVMTSIDTVMYTVFSIHLNTEFEISLERRGRTGSPQPLTPRFVEWHVFLAVGVDTLLGRGFREIKKKSYTKNLSPVES